MFHSVMLQCLCRWSERYNETRLPVPEEWQVVVGDSETSIRSLQLRMPNCRY